MPNSATENYRQLHAEIECSKAAEFLSSLKAFESNYYIYEKNYEDLVSCLESTEKVGLHLAAVDGPGKESNARKTYKEIARLVFNFLSAAKARIDYTRSFVEDNYEGSPFIVSYKEYISVNFNEDELSKFVNDLRNYIVHKGIPHISIRVNWTNSDPYVYIDRDKVIDSSVWGAHSKSFLSKKDAQLKLHPIFVEYGDKIKAQTDWIIRELYKYHASYFEKLKQLQLELDAVQSELNK